MKRPRAKPGRGEPATVPRPAPDEAALVEALRRGDERAYATLVGRHHRSLLRLARLYVRDHAVGEEVVQETWLGVLQGISRFEGRSSLKTWIFRILVNRAKTRAAREGRSVPFSAHWDSGAAAPEPAVEAERFRGETDPYPHHWASPPRPWGANPEELVLRDEVLAVIQRAIAELPPSQREVITLRDVEGWTAAEVCNVLEIADTNQRVLLHRALERYWDRE